MKKITDANLKFEQVKLSRKEAEDFLKKKGEKYKLELLKDIPDKEVSFYKHGDFMDLCKGPIIRYTKQIKAVKLLNIASAYWRGKEDNPVLQRIYGISFPSKTELEEYLAKLEDAKKRDHNKLGRQLDIFLTSDVVGKGLPLLTPKGATMKRILRRFIEDEELKRGYQFTDTPILAKTELYKISGHYAHFKDNMFIFKTEEGDEMALRPMTCPHQFMIYKSKPHSYRELPLRYAEIASLFRYEKSGELHGMTRVYQFTLADAHIFCRPEQVESEFQGVLELVKYVMSSLGLSEKEYWYRFSKWDPKNKEKYIDDPKAWNEMQAMMKKILDKLKVNYVEAENEAAFYGPKLDVQMRNVFGKEDTMFTIQIDFALPERFGLEYIGEDGKTHRPIIVHRASIGCLERTMAMLIEKYAGAFPLWFSPVQVILLPIADRHVKYADTVKKELEAAGLRVDTDYSQATTEYKIRDAQLQKVPYIIVLGDKEEEKQTLAVRDRDTGKVKFGIKTDDFIKSMLEQIKNKK
jgi:threonyl-tRNA synthetase